MYKKVFELINDKLNTILVDKTKYPLELDKNSYELKKLEIRGNKVKFIFLNHDQLTIKVMNFEIDWLGLEPRLKYKNDYLKPYTDKYFR